MLLALWGMQNFISWDFVKHLQTLNQEAILEWQAGWKEHLADNSCVFSDTGPHNVEMKTEHCIIKAESVTSVQFANTDLLLQSSSVTYKWDVLSWL